MSGHNASSLEQGPPDSPPPMSCPRMGPMSVVLEQDRIVGGIARTVEHKGYRFDIGGHRFFSKVPLHQRMVDEHTRRRFPASIEAVAHPL